MHSVCELSGEAFGMLDCRGIFCLYTAGKVSYNEGRNKQLDKNEKFKGFDAAEPLKSYWDVRSS